MHGQIDIRTHAFTNTNATSFPFAAAGPAVKSFESDSDMTAEESKKAVRASTGGTTKSRLFEPEPHLVTLIVLR